MSIPTGPFFIRDRRIRNEIAVHRARVFAALSQHSDPSMRELGRLLAEGTATPRELIEDEPAHRTGRKPGQAALDELRRHVFGPDVQFDPPLSGRAATPHEPGAMAAQAAEPQAQSARPSKTHDVPPRRAATPAMSETPAATPGAPVNTWNCHVGARRSNEPGPASRPDYSDPDNGAGGVPAIRR